MADFSRADSFLAELQEAQRLRVRTAAETVRGGLQGALRAAVKTHGNRAKYGSVVQDIAILRARGRMRDRSMGNPDDSFALRVKVPFPWQFHEFGYYLHLARSKYIVYRRPTPVVRNAWSGMRERVTAIVGG
jgi:hypothetical protein